MENEHKKLIVLFPGRRYTLEGPLLYYAHLKYSSMGYESLGIAYGDSNDIDDIKNFVFAQLKAIDFSSYNDIVFLSKSIGTVIAGSLAETVHKNVRQIFLTPINNTLQFIKSEKNIGMVIAGTKDPLLDATVLTEHCKREHIRLELIDGADHSLEIPGDVQKNIDILKQTVQLF